MMDSKFSIAYLILVVLLVLVPCSLGYEVSSTLLSGSDSLSLSSNGSLVSYGEIFEFGYFSLVPNSNRWYMGIWYKQIPVRSYVWVANRNKPVNTLNATLQIVDGELSLRRQSDNFSFWSSTRESSESSSSSPVVAELLDTGNLVLRYSKNKDPRFYLWQSFNHPTDTLLPHMELGSDPTQHTNKFLSSWRSPYDPAIGDFKFILDAQGSPEFSVILGSAQLYRSGPWNGFKFAGLPDFVNLTWNRDDGIAVFTPTYSNSYTRLEMTVDGQVMLLTWNITTTKWDTPWTSTLNKCDLYNFCGSNAFCDTKNLPSACDCIPGFEHKKTNETSSCLRKTGLICGGDRFSKLSNMNFPVEPTEFDYIKEIKECEKMCVADCNCTAFSVTDALRIGSSSCFVWRGDLRDVRRYNNSDDGGDLYIRINGKRSTNRGAIIGWSVAGSIVAAFVLLLLVYWYCKTKQKRARAIEMEATVPREIEMTGSAIIDNRLLPPMDFGTILKATNTFSTEIGHGGFGNVYKGRLPNGQEIAVKKLKTSSRHSTEQFYTEVKAIASVQHVNVVGLLGWSVHNEEKLLIYEYMEKGSLERYLFDAAKSCELTWKMRFDIIIGVARGLAYLQNESRVKIVHRDLKPANVLLDKDMIPKISDFGLARVSLRSENENEVTVHSFGTYGYMSPEYAGDGIYSSKSDIYSFGVTVLEIVSGKRNKALIHSDPSTNFVSYVWIKWNEGNWEEIVDQNMIQDSSPPSQLLRCIEIALLCVQQKAADRPSMPVVLAKLENEALQIPRPKPPGYFTEKDVASSSKTSEEASTSTSTFFQVAAWDTQVSGR